MPLKASLLADNLLLPGFFTAVRAFHISFSTHMGGFIYCKIGRHVFVLTYRALVISCHLLNPQGAEAA